MKFFTAVTVAALASFAAAYTNADMPACAKTCISKAAPEVGCGADDTACQCQKHDELSQKAIKCVINSCSSEDAQKAAQVSQDVCSSQ